MKRVRVSKKMPLLSDIIGEIFELDQDGKLKGMWGYYNYVAVTILFPSCTK